MSPIRVLIAEDQTLMRDGLRTILELEDGFQVAGVASDGREAVELALRLRPDIVLMDVQMPHLDGVGATARLAAELPQTRVVILTTFDYDEYVFEGLKAGARGYLLKEMPAPELLDAIRRVHAELLCGSSRRPDRQAARPQDRAAAPAVSGRHGVCGRRDDHTRRVSCE
ncbi:MAG: response regulator transcription factor [Chloroflexales bacterium]|nr:response regulator transcription factor [Chloroflexales bacterium]